MSFKKTIKELSSCVFLTQQTNQTNAVKTHFGRLVPAMSDVQCTIQMRYSLGRSRSLIRYSASEYAARTGGSQLPISVQPTRNSTSGQRTLHAGRHLVGRCCRRRRRGCVVAAAAAVGVVVLVAGLVVAVVVVDDVVRLLLLLQLLLPVWLLGSGLPGRSGSTNNIPLGPAISPGFYLICIVRVCAPGGGHWHWLCRTYMCGRIDAHAGTELAPGAPLRTHTHAHADTT